MIYSIFLDNHMELIALVKLIVIMLLSAKKMQNVSTAPVSPAFVHCVKYYN